MANEELVATIRAELGPFKAQMQETARVVEQASKQSAAAMGTFNSSIATVRSSLQGLGVSLSAAGLVAFTKTAIEAANRFNAFALSLKNATGSSAAAQQALAFVRTEANRLGLDLTKASEGFARLANATRGTALAGEATREIFTALSESSRVLGLSTEEYGRALTAVGQIALKGRVQQEELLQLAEAGIPIYGALAQSLGKTTGELAKMLEQGQVSATQLGAAFSVLRQQTDGVAEASQSFAAQTTRLSNAFTEFLTTIGRLITENPEAIRLLQTLTKTIQILEQIARKNGMDILSRDLKDVNNIVEVVNAGLGTVTVTALQKVETELATTSQQLRYTKGHLETLEDISSKSWLAYTYNLGGAIPRTKELAAQITNLKDKLDQLKLKEEELILLRASAAQSERFARFPSAGKVGGEDLLGLSTPGLRDYHAELTAIETVATNVRKELVDIKTQTEIFGKGDALKRARAELSEYEKGQTKISEVLAKAPELLKKQPPELVKILDEQKKGHAAALKQVEILEKQKEAQTKATQDAIQAGKERVKGEEETREELIRLSTDHFAVEHQLLDRQVAEKLKRGEAETLVTAFQSEARQKIRIEETTAMFALLEQEALKREETEDAQTAIVEKEAQNRLQIENTIAKRSQQGTKTRLDDMKEQFRQEEELLKDKGATNDQLDRLRLANTEALHRAETEETEKALKEQSKDYERFVKDVQETTGRFIFDVLSGRIQSFKDLLGTVKDSFLKLLSDMAAAALARPIALMLTTAAGGLGLNALLGLGTQAATGAVTGGAGGGGGLLGGLLGVGGQVGGAALSGAGGAAGGGAGGTLGGVGGALGGAGAASWLSGALGTSLIGGYGAGTTTAASFFGGGAATTGAFTTGAGAQAGLTGVATPVAGAGLTLGTALLAAGVGIAGGFALRQLNNMIGLTDLLGKRGSSALAGAGGGAAAGAIAGSAIPGIGTAFGALGGALIGALGGGLLGGGKKLPSYQTTGGLAPAVSFLPGMGVTIPQTFSVSGRGQAGLPGAAAGKISATLGEAANTLFGELESTMRQFPLTLQATAAPHLHAMTQSFEGHFRNVRFGGENLAKDLESWATKALPEAFHATFDPIIKSMQKLAPVVAKFDELISALEQRQAEILSGIASARQSIEEALIPPGELAATRRAGLWTTLNRLHTGTPAEQMQLAPQLAGQTQEVFAQGLQQFQQEQALFQQRQGTALSAIGGARQGISQALLTPAQRQPDLWAMLDQVNRAAPEIQFELATELAAVTQQVFDQFLAQQNAAIQAFQQQQAQVLATIQGVRQSISEALLTPAQLAATREQTLQTLLGQFRAGTTAVQMELAPQIAGLTQEVFNQFLAQHQQAIQAFQQQQQQVLSTIEGARQSISSAMLTPDQLGATREQTLQTLLSQFRAGTTAVRMELAPQIAGLTQEVFNAFLQQQQQAIQAFQQQQAQVLSTIEGARQSISSAMLTPEQLGATQKQTLQTLLGQFRAGTTAVRMELAPQIAGLTQEVFNAFLQQQQQAIQAFQAQQEQVLATIQGARQSVSQALLTPDQLAASQRGTLQALLSQFRAGATTVRMELAPQIASLTQEVMSEFLQQSQQAMQAFQQQQHAVLSTIQQARWSLAEATLTPEQVAFSRQGTLQTMLGQFRRASRAVQMEMAPQIASLTEEVLNRFLQQSQQAMQIFQQQQHAALVSIQAAGWSIADAMLTPEQLVFARQGTLQVLLSQFRAASTAVRQELVPQVASLTQEVFHRFLQQQNQAIQAFQQQQTQVMASIRAARESLHAIVDTPAQLFEAQKREIADLMTQFRGGTPAEQLELGPQIAELTQSALRLAAGEDVLEQDRLALRMVQEQLLGVLDEIEATTQRLQGPDPAAIAAMQQQMVGILGELEGVTRNAVAPGLAEATAVQRQMLAVLAEVESVTRHAVAPGLAEATVVQRQMLAILAEVESVTRHAVAPGLGAVAALQQQMLGILAEVESVTRNAVAPGLGAVAALQQQMLGVLAEVEAVTRNAVAPGLADVAAKQQQMLGVLAEVESVTRNAVAPGLGLVAAKQQEMIALLTALEAVTRATAGPDTNELRAFQNSMLYILAETEHATRQSFGATLQAANDQKTLLLESLHMERMIEFRLTDAIAWLAHLSAQLGWIGSFQTSPGQSRQVHMTGLAVVHRGETVSRGTMSNNTFAPSISVQVTVPPGSNGHAVGQEVGQQIFKTIRDLQVRQRYRQSRRF